VVYRSERALQPTRICSQELPRGTLCHLCRAKAFATADHPCSKLQGIPAKTNKFIVFEELENYGKKKVRGTVFGAIESIISGNSVTRGRDRDPYSYVGRDKEGIGYGYLFREDEGDPRSQRYRFACEGRLTRRSGSLSSSNCIRLSSFERLHGQ
jgi:hypothetical protein